MIRKLASFIKHFRICLLFFGIYVAYNISERALHHLSNEKAVIVRNAPIYTTQNVYSSAYPIFSVIGINTTDAAEWDIFAVNAWVNQTANRSAAFCCYLMDSGVVITKKNLRINQRREMFKYTAQVECPNPDKSIKVISSVLSGITLSETGVCTERNDYVKPYYPKKQTDEFSFAVCGKFIFGDINIELTIEWMEYNKYMGVKKVILYPYNISSKVSKMLEFYRLNGFINIVPYSLPPRAGEESRPGEKTLAAWNEEQLVLYDCQSRLRGYQYVGVIDLDEFIVPIIDRNFKKMLARLIYVLPNMIAAEVYGEMFILDWEKTNEKGALIISQYENRTVSKAPNIDINQRKLIHIPSRVQRGSVITHGCKPLNSSFQMIFKDPMSVMSINHYRGCANYRKNCFDRERVTDKRIVRFLTKVQIAVHETKENLDTFW